MLSHTITHGSGLHKHLLFTTVLLHLLISFANILVYPLHVRLFILLVLETCPHPSPHTANTKLLEYNTVWTSLSFNFAAIHNMCSWASPQTRALDCETLLQYWSACQYIVLRMGNRIYCYNKSSIEWLQRNQYSASKGSMFPRQIDMNRISVSLRNSYLTK